MMNDDTRWGPATAPPEADAPDAGAPAAEAPAQAAAEAPADATAAADGSVAIMKFKSCRWRCDPEAGEFCTHRDVLPFAGKEGFVADSWCPECAFYKLRRTPKKRERVDYTY